VWLSWVLALATWQNIPEDDILQIYFLRNAVLLMQLNTIKELGRICKTNGNN
jgi:hypothetical protein